MAIEVENQYDKKTHPKHYVIVRELARGRKISAEALSDKIGFPLSNRMMGLIIERLASQGVAVERTRDQANGTEYKATVGEAKPAPKKAVAKKAVAKKAEAAVVVVADAAPAKKAVSGPVKPAKVKAAARPAKKSAKPVAAPVKPVKAGSLKSKAKAKTKGGIKR